MLTALLAGCGESRGAGPSGEGPREPARRRAIRRRATDALTP